MFCILLWKFSFTVCHKNLRWRIHYKQVGPAPPKVFLQVLIQATVLLLCCSLRSWHFAQRKWDLEGLLWCIARCWQIFSLVYSKLWKSYIEPLGSSLDISHCFLHPLFFFFLFNASMYPQMFVPQPPKCQPTSSSCLLLQGQVRVIFELTSEGLLASSGWKLARFTVYSIIAALSFHSPPLRLISGAIIFNPWQQDEDKSLSM